ncbi:NarL family two-component system sensor histidine kinase LiaS [Cytobacillus eiseniae]|uniref:Sensor histidine kinase n=1 Tax=Cytobacillus eiseniae TaxID=762947 RepID=A0ABS4RG83_9BACI|nr:sensor histidine kinase [Cytobacillus eiseniae]MBP2241912.1 NarL family two-component system sensor histidine kinase LiaS [Cytobacillus eiseniae]
MSAVQRQIIWGVGLAVFICALFTVTIFIRLPLIDWRVLWETNVMDIPFIIFVPSVSIVIGIIFGFISGFHGKKQIESVDSWLYQIEEGRQLELDELQAGTELQPIVMRVEKIQKQITEQAKLSQKLANEKAEDIENRMQEIISQERNRLARELHDSVSQQLFAASMMMSAINEAKGITDNREAKQLKMVEEMIHQSQLEMRALLLHLRPVALKGKTLKEGIEELLIELSQKVTMNIKWKVEDFPLDKGIEDHLFRILQESVSNTLRHSKSTTLEVLLIQRDEFVILRVVDDGIGFDVEEAKAGSYGMQNMYERAIEVGGSMKIISLKNNGTRLEVRVPIMNAEGEAND